MAVEGVPTQGLPGSAFLRVAKRPVTNETDGPRPAVEAPMTSAVPNRLCVECSGERGKDYDEHSFHTFFFSLKLISSYICMW